MRGDKSTTLLAESVGSPAATSTTEIKDGLDFETIVRHYFRKRGWILSHYSTEEFMLFVFDMDEGKDGKKG